MQDALTWLREMRFVDLDGANFVITDSGLDYLIEGRGPGGLPPTDPSRVPRRPLPIAGLGQIALPEPNLDADNETV
jgi:hypothetical protein